MQARGSPEQSRSAPAQRGRPRDPAIEARIVAAALAVYAAHGWQGFNFESVARSARVSRDALYRRWPSREALLEDILRPRSEAVKAIDHGNVRVDLLALAHLTLDLYAGSHGEVALQLRVDARRYEAVAAFAGRYREELVRLGRRIVRRAIERGELPEDVGPSLIMDLLIGGIINHVSSTPAALREAMIEQADAFIRAAVDILLLGSRGRSDR